VEVAFGVETGHRGPGVCLDIIDLTFIHGLIGQGRAYRKDLGLAPVRQHTGQCVRPPLKQHVSSLDQPLLQELIAIFCGFSGLPTSSEEDPALFVLDRHEVGRDLDVDHIGAVAVRPEVVHEQIVSVIHKKVQRIQHVSVVDDAGDFDGLLDELLDLLFRPVLILDQLYTSLLVLFLEQVLAFLEDLLRLLSYLIYLRGALEESDVVPGVKLLLLLLQVPLKHVRLHRQVIGLVLNVDEVGIFEDFVEFVEFGLFELI